MRMRERTSHFDWIRFSHLWIAFCTIFNWKFSHLFVSWFTFVYFFLPPTAALSKPTGKIRFCVFFRCVFYLSSNECLLSKEKRWIKSIGNVRKKVFECCSIPDLLKINARKNLEHFFSTFSFACFLNSLLVPFPFRSFQIRFWSHFPQDT